MIYADINKKLERLRKRLYENIYENGIDSTETKDIITEIEKKLEEFLGRKINVLQYEYEISNSELKKFSKSKKEWDIFAKENQYLNLKLMQQIKEKL